MTHSAGALYEAFPAPEAHRVWRRLEFHYTPKHASWLNMVEIEIGVLRGQCLDRRIGARDRLVSEIAAWEQQRNPAGSRTPGCSPPSALAPKWPALTPTLPKCHNPCAEVLESHLLDAAVRNGADLVGGIDPLEIDRDPKGQLDGIFSIAVQHGVGLDIHLHEPGEMGLFNVQEICARTRALGLGGKVTISHGFASAASPSGMRLRRRR